jgi:hypothetical protein
MATTRRAFLRGLLASAAVVPALPAVLADTAMLASGPLPDGWRYITRIATPGYSRLVFDEAEKALWHHQIKLPPPGCALVFDEAEKATV